MGEREIAGGRGGTRVSLAYRWTGNIWKYRNCDNFIKEDNSLLEGSFIYLSFFFFFKKLLRFFNFSFPIVERVWKNSFRSASRAKKRFDISTIFLSLSLSLHHFPLRPKASRLLPKHPSLFPFLSRSSRRGNVTISRLFIPTYEISRRRMPSSSQLLRDFSKNSAVATSPPFSSLSFLSKASTSVYPNTVSSRELR